MQLIEVSVTGVRSAVITLQSAQASMRILLFPMVHLAAPGFYASVAEHLARCDLIVAEGVAGASPAVSALTLAYRLPAHNRRLALAVQDIPYADLGVPVIRPDIGARQFGKRWRRVPWLQRAAIWCLVPLFALSFTLLGTRRTLSRHLAYDDMPAPEEELARHAMPQLTELIVDHRDGLLLDCLASIHRERHGERIDVAVVYGAAHMPAITHELHRRYGYRPRTAEWLTVFDF
jgi:hypothetical protein